MKVLLSRFHLNGHTIGFFHRLKTDNYVVHHNKQHQGKVLLNSFQLNGHISGFHPRAQKLELPCTAHLTIPQESTAQ